MSHTHSAPPTPPVHGAQSTDTRKKVVRPFFRKVKTEIHDFFHHHENPDDPHQHHRRTTSGTASTLSTKSSSDSPFKSTTSRFSSMRRNSASLSLSKDKDPEKSRSIGYNLSKTVSRSSSSSGAANPDSRSPPAGDIPESHPTPLEISPKVTETSDVAAAEVAAPAPYDLTPSALNVRDDPALRELRGHSEEESSDIPPGERPSEDALSVNDPPATNHGVPCNLSKDSLPSQTEEMVVPEVDEKSIAGIKEEPEEEEIRQEATEKVALDAEERPTLEDEKASASLAEGAVLEAEIESTPQAGGELSRGAEDHQAIGRVETSLEERNQSTSAPELPELEEKSLPSHPSEELKVEEPHEHIDHRNNRSSVLSSVTVPAEQAGDSWDIYDIVDIDPLEELEFGAKSRASRASTVQNKAASQTEERLGDSWVIPELPSRTGGPHKKGSIAASSELDAGANERVEEWLETAVGTPGSAEIPSSASASISRRRNAAAVNVPSTSRLPPADSHTPASNAADRDGEGIGSILELVVILPFIAFLCVYYPLQNLRQAASARLISWLQPRLYSSR